MPRVAVDEGICTLCRVCVDICPTGVFDLEGGALEPTREEDCIVCRACEASCPVEAIVVEG